MTTTDPLIARAFAQWRAERADRGESVSLLDLYEMVAADRGVSAHELPDSLRRELGELAMPIVMPGWSLTNGSGRAPDPIVVVDYDPGWPQVFGGWHDRLRGALGATALRIEHVGSTSVPGLAAKPIVDVQVSVADLEDEATYVPALNSIGLQLRLRDDAHRFFRPPPDRPRDVHVHVCPAGSEWEAEHLLLRDYLRAHPPASDAYATVKREAADHWHHDRMAYTDAKTRVILDLLAEARRGQPRRAAPTD